MDHTGAWTPGDPSGGDDLNKPPERVLTAEEQRHQAMIFAAMQEELGVTRKDALPLEDRGAIPMNTLSLMVKKPRKVAAGVEGWCNAEFNDIDPDQTGDNIADGQLYRLRQASASAGQRGNVGREGMASRGGRGGGSARGGLKSTRGGFSNRNVSYHASGRRVISNDARNYGVGQARVDSVIERLRAPPPPLLPEVENPVSRKPDPCPRGSNSRQTPSKARSSRPTVPFALSSAAVFMAHVTDRPVQVPRWETAIPPAHIEVPVVLNNAVSQQQSVTSTTQVAPTPDYLEPSAQAARAEASLEQSNVVSQEIPVLPTPYVTTVETFSRPATPVNFAHLATPASQPDAQVAAVAEGQGSQASTPMFGAGLSISRWATDVSSTAAVLRRMTPSPIMPSAPQVDSTPASFHGPTVPSTYRVQVRRNGSLPRPGSAALAKKNSSDSLFTLELVAENGEIWLNEVVSDNALVELDVHVITYQAVQGPSESSPTWHIQFPMPYQALQFRNILGPRQITSPTSGIESMPNTPQASNPSNPVPGSQQQGREALTGTARGNQPLHVSQASASAAQDNTASPIVPQAATKEHHGELISFDADESEQETPKAKSGVFDLLQENSMGVDNLPASSMNRYTQAEQPAQSKPLYKVASQPQLSSYPAEQKPEAGFDDSHVKYPPNQLLGLRNNAVPVDTTEQPVRYQEPRHVRPSPAPVPSAAPGINMSAWQNFGAESSEKRSERSPNVPIHRVTNSGVDRLSHSFDNLKIDVKAEDTTNQDIPAAVSQHGSSIKPTSHVASVIRTELELAPKSLSIVTSQRIEMMVNKIKAELTVPQSIFRVNSRATSSRAFVSPNLSAAELKPEIANISHAAQSSQLGSLPEMKSGVVTPPPTDVASTSVLPATSLPENSTADGAQSNAETNHDVGTAGATASDAGKKKSKLDIVVTKGGGLAASKWATDDTKAQVPEISRFSSRHSRAGSRDAQAFHYGPPPASIHQGITSPPGFAPVYRTVLIPNPATGGWREVTGLVKTNLVPMVAHAAVPVSANQQENSRPYMTAPPVATGPFYPYLARSDMCSRHFSGDSSDSEKPFKAAAPAFKSSPQRATQPAGVNGARVPLSPNRQGQNVQVDVPARLNRSLNGGGGHPRL